MNQQPTGKLTQLEHPKVSSFHLERLAYIYVRQSSLKQVYHNQESQMNQYRLQQRAQELGFTLTEIKELLTLTESVDAECSDVRQRALDKIRNVEHRMRDLTRIKRTLQELAARCPRSADLDDCPILRALDDRRSK